MIKSIVTGDFGRTICDAYGIHVFEALTGFKNICGRIPELESKGCAYFFGYEESIGCAPGEKVRDKDGVCAGMLMMELAAYCEERGFRYCPDPGEKSATIGGNISTNAGGMRAMKYGVTEYLLKPTSLMDFEHAMAHVEEQVMLDRSRKPAEIGSIDQVFRDLLLGRMKATPELERYLSDNYGIRSDSRFTLILCCPGSPFEDRAREYNSNLSRILQLFSQCRYVTVDFSYRKVLATVAYDYASPGSVQAILHSRLADLGPDAAAGQRMMIAIPRGVTFGAENLDPAGYSFVSCATAPRRGTA